MHKIIIAFAALVLASCATLQNPITSDRLTTIKEGYGLVLSAAVAYRNSCDQRLIPSSCRKVVPQLVSADAKVRVALGRLSSIQKLGPSISTAAAIDQLSAAVNDFKVIAASNGVQ